MSSYLISLVFGTQFLGLHICIRLQSYSNTVKNNNLGFIQFSRSIWPSCGWLIVKYFFLVPSRVWCVMLTWVSPEYRWHDIYIWAICLTCIWWRSIFFTWFCEFCHFDNFRHRFRPFLDRLRLLVKKIWQNIKIGSWGPPVDRSLKWTTYWKIIEWPM